MQKERKHSITKKQLVETLGQDHMFNKDVVSNFYDDLIEIMDSYLLQGHSITLRHLGHFEVVKSKPHKFHNPNNGKIETTSPKYHLSFTCSKALNKEINDYYTKIKKHPY